MKSRNLIDTVMLIKRATQMSKELNAEFYTIEEYPLSPAQRALIDKISNGDVKQTSIAELFKADLNKDIAIKHYYTCYGAPNEVENIISRIYKETPLDKCVVAVTNPVVYSQLFFDYSLLYNIPITFGTGIPITNSNPAKLLKLYYHWMTDGFFGSVAIKDMINSPVFDKGKMYERLSEAGDYNKKKFEEVLGDLRLSNIRERNDAIIEEFEKAVNREEANADSKDTKAYDEILKKVAVIPAIKLFADELAAPCEVFISRYSKIRKGSETIADRLLMMLDATAASRIYDELSIIRASGISQADEDIIQNILKEMVCKGSAQAGALHVTTIKGAFASVRDHLFVAGLASSMFPGSPKENYLLLDDDLDKFGKDSYYLTSTGRIEIKKQSLDRLIRIANGLNANISISYPGLDVSELKKDNASSSVFEIYQAEVKKNVTISDLEKRFEKIEYFEPAISDSRKIGKAYINDEKISKELPFTKPWAFFKGDLEKSYSPSALNTFFGCPMCFMISRLLGIEEPEEDKPFEVISAADMGTLAHTMMEISGENPQMSEDKFKEICSNAFDTYISEHTPLILGDAKVKKEEFLDMMANAYRMETKREVMLKEEDIECTHESGVKIHGFPDRVEKLSDGTYCVVDFKTARNLEHVQDDIKTCLQVIIYAYILEKTMNIKVSRGEFRYIRLGQTVTCRYDDAMKNDLNDMLNYFKDAMENDEFPIPDKEIMEEQDTCKYCKFGDICGKNPDWEDMINV